MYSFKSADKDVELNVRLPRDSGFLALDGESMLELLLTIDLLVAFLSSWPKRKTCWELFCFSSSILRLTKILSKKSLYFSIVSSDGSRFFESSSFSN